MGGTPILLIPVARSYPWVDDQLQNELGDYPGAMKAVVAELVVLLIDLNQRLVDHFSEIGRDHVSVNYFMNLSVGAYEAYPDGQDDNTHFRPAGARAVAGLVFEKLKMLERIT